MLSDYQERLDYLYSRLNYEWLGMPRVPAELRLGRMRRLLRRLGDPQVGLRIIHVAGTKGKGSTAAMMAAALTAAGVRTGLYCSPHLHRLEERFTDRRPPASPDELVALVDDGPARSSSGSSSKTRHTAHSPLDLLRDHHGDGPAPLRPPQVGAVVLEVGMGGRLDSTNVVHPASVDHHVASRSTTRGSWATRWRAIATEKAGILKRGRPAVSGVRGAEARAGDPTAWPRSGGAALRELGVDFDYRRHPARTRP